MGTNFYWHEKPDCPTCGSNDQGLHICKRAAGWRISFQAHLEHDLTSWQGWKAKIRSGGLVKDEYGKVWEAEEFIAMIEKWETSTWVDGTPLLKHAYRYPSPDDYFDRDGYNFSTRDFD